MAVERIKIRQKFATGTKLVLIGGIIFATATIVFMSQPSLGSIEQGWLFWVTIGSFIVWMAGGMYLGMAGDQWLSGRLDTKAYRNE